MFKPTFTQKIIGYLIVIGIITLITFAILYFQKGKGGSDVIQGKYAEDIQANVLYPVTHVVDGDTLIANVAGHEVTIRLLGINTPETVDPRKPVECYGPEASAEGKKLLIGKEVYIERETNREAYDKYGRVLAYVRLPDGTFYNQFMVEQGYAREYTFNNEKYTYQKDFKKAQAGAQKGKLGLWSACPI